MGQRFNHPSFFQYDWQLIIPQHNVATTMLGTEVVLFHIISVFMDFCLIFCLSLFTWFCFPFFLFISAKQLLEEKVKFPTKYFVKLKLFEK